MFDLKECRWSARAVQSRIGFADAGAETYYYELLTETGDQEYLGADEPSREARLQARGKLIASRRAVGEGRG